MMKLRYRLAFISSTPNSSRAHGSSLQTQIKHHCSSMPSPRVILLLSLIVQASASCYNGAQKVGASAARGLCYTDSQDLVPFSNDTSMSWAYNWTPLGPDVPSGLEFVPMLHDTGWAAAWDSLARKAVAQGSRHLLSFNEPDEIHQADLTPEAAAEAYIRHMNPLGSIARIGAPAVTNSVQTSPPMGTYWLQGFMDACQGHCHIDFFTFHFYDSEASLIRFEEFLDHAIAVARQYAVSEIWLTEYGIDGTLEQQAQFVKASFPVLAARPEVSRHAYFACIQGLMVNASALTVLGRAYA